MGVWKQGDFLIGLWAQMAVLYWLLEANEQCEDISNEDCFMLDGGIFESSHFLKQIAGLMKCFFCGQTVIMAPVGE